MRLISKVLVMGTLAAILGGCQFLPEGLFGGGDDTVSDDVEAVPIPTDDPVAEGDDPDAVAEEPVDETLAVPAPPPPGDADLIASTNADERIRQITQERDNPFALIPATPRIISPDPATQATPPAQPETPAPGATPPPPTGELAEIPELVPQIPAGPPPPPPTDLARAVVVTGVVQIGSTVHAIVSAPNEPHSRYVREGQMLSNGQVLVRRIEFVPGGEARVILEQNGVEIVRAVGEGGLPTDTTTASANTLLPVVPLDSSI
jgi:hypothetical protein